ncbi:aldo/keto reductase [Fundicoccus sp. Sow4_H7]|uniref:aldo/keto reductase n=1 Tax=Fundicoccus sp. Sow4_H7 TaxID=3438784 RepID=UPI003F935024
MEYRNLGSSGLKVPILSLGLWNNFGNNRDFGLQKEIVNHAFEAGITYFDLANNYGPPAGSAEINFGRIFHESLRSHRHELIIATKAGNGMWGGPYGKGGSRKHLLTSIDQSLDRLGLDYVDIFYSHRPDTETPFEETAEAMRHIINSGKALYIGLSNYDAEQTQEMTQLLLEKSIPIVVHQPSYSMFNHWAEITLFPTVKELSLGVAAYSPLAQGLLTSRYLNGIPSDSRAAGNTNPWLTPEHVEQTLEKVQKLNKIANERNQSLSQLALTWNLRDQVVATNIIGVSSVAQLEDNLISVTSQMLTNEELDEISNILDN